MTIEQLIVVLNDRTNYVVSWETPTYGRDINYKRGTYPVTYQVAINDAIDISREQSPGQDVEEVILLKNFIDVRGASLVRLEV